MECKIFLGYDPREAIGFHVCIQSIIETTLKEHPLQLVPLHGAQRDGTNAFTYARFLVPFLCDYRGAALFIDGSDMLVRENIENLIGLFDPRKAVQVVKHDYVTRHPRKYIGTSLEADNRSYPRKNWSSVMLFNCEHPCNHSLTPRFVSQMLGADLHRFCWLRDEEIGELPPKWNVLIGEDNDDQECAIAHFTLGIPAFPHYSECRYANEWRGRLV